MYNYKLKEITLMIKVGIIGANGYTGYELMRMLAAHPKVKVVYAASRSNAGTPAANLYPSLSGAYGDMLFDAINFELCAKNCDVVFTALPHGVSAETCAAVLKAGGKNIKVIDLSADFRYDSIPLFNTTYGIEHPCAGLNQTAVYGLSELFRSRVKEAQIVANPGCYPTASILALYPLVKEKLISPSGIIVDAKSGATGAGRQASEAFSLCESSGNFKAYGVTTHRHTSEIEEKLGANALMFTPHLLPVKRGILATCYADIEKAAEKDIFAAYEKYYKNEPFVKVGADIPDLNYVVNSNECRIGFKIDARAKKIIIVSVIDNLIKGASGQAIQNMNIMFGFDERLGLPACGNQL